MQAAAGFSLGHTSGNHAVNNEMKSRQKTGSNSRQGMMSVKKFDKLSELKERCFNRLNRERQQLIK